MDLSLSAGAGFETGASLTGTFQVSLTRAVLPYRDAGDRVLPGGRLADIGLGVVVDGSDPLGPMWLTSEAPRFGSWM